VSFENELVPLNGRIVFSSAFCVSVSVITPEPLDISSQNLHGIILLSKGRTSLKMAIYRCAGGD